MGNSKDKTKDLEQENAHPAPNADPGAEIETVIPSTKKEDDSAKSPDVPQEEDSANGSDKPAEETSEQNQERVGAGDNADDIEQKGEPEVPENEGGESKTDEHGIETISP